jgi:hypothetical protein
MKDTLIFLGSGASAPFGLPTMKDFVDDFDQLLRTELASGTSNLKEMKTLYEDIKNTLIRIHGYVDLESVFTVIEAISRNVEYAELGFPCSYFVSKIN